MRIIMIMFLCTMLVSCGLSEEEIRLTAITETTQTAKAWTATPSQTSTFTLVPTLTPTITSTFTPTVSVTPSPEPLEFTSSWDRYQPRTLASIIKNTTDEVNPGSDLLIWVNYGDDTPSIVKVEYTGEFRELSEIRKTLVRMWSHRYGITEAQALVLFQHEGRFVENGVNYWMPVQSHLIPYMEDELQIGQKVELLVVWPGVVNENGESIWIFFVNTF
jgi:hypothetical protein